MNTELLLAYAFGYVVFAIAISEDTSVSDVVASLIVAIVWPVLLPARIVRKLIR